MSRVCILTAGQGSRLGQRTKYFNKCLLRVGNKAVISHQIDGFPKDTEFVIALGYKGDIVRQYLQIAHSDNKFIFVEVDGYGKGFGPGYALIKCREYLQCPFYFLSCDTLTDDNRKFSPGDWVEYSTIEKDKCEQYCTLDLVNNRVHNFYDKSKNGTDKAFIGTAFIEDYNQFWNLLDSEKPTIDNEIQLAPVFLRMDLIKAFEVRQWFDVGSEDGLLDARDYYQGIQNLDKLDEELYIIGDEVIKYFYNESMVTGRLQRAKNLKGLVPDIISSSKNFYKYKFVCGEDLFRIDGAARHITSLLKYSKENLWKDIRLSEYDKIIFKDACKKFYKDKTNARINKLFSDKGLKDLSLTINDLPVLDIYSLLDLVDWNRICEGVPSNYHGDFAPGNIIYNYKNNEFKFIDYRQDFAGLIDCGDRYYDFAKLYAGFLFPLQSVREGNLYVRHINSTSIKTFIEISYDIEKSKDYFEDFIQSEGYDINKIRILAAIVLINMSPLHESPLHEWLYYFGKYYLTKNLSKNV